MFEKEDFDKYMKDSEDYYDNREPMTERKLFQLWKDGAEFAYNKANEWHYVKDKLPPEDVPLLCVRGGNIYVAWYYNSVYHDDRCCQVQKPYAWKEIVPPELKENKEND